MAPSRAEMVQDPSVPVPSKGRRRKRESKLAKLPSNARVSKRPIAHPPLPSPHTSSATPKVIYVSSKTPFMSAVRRIRDTLALVRKRRSQSIYTTSKRDRNIQDHVLAAAIKDVETKGRVGEDEFVTVKGTGKCIEKVLGIGGFFLQNLDSEGVWVKMVTGSLWVIDDIEVGKEQDDGNEDVEEGSNDQDQEGDIPETRLRQVSVLEVRIGLR